LAIHLIKPQHWNTKLFRWSISAPTKSLKMIDGRERHDRNITYGAQTIAALARSRAMERGRGQIPRGGGPAKWCALASGWDGERPGGWCIYTHRNNTQNLEYCGNLLERNLGGGGVGGQALGTQDPRNSCWYIAFPFYSSCEFCMDSVKF